MCVACPLLYSERLLVRFLFAFDFDCNPHPALYSLLSKLDSGALFVRDLFYASTLTLNWCALTVGVLSWCDLIGLYSLGAL